MKTNRARNAAPDIGAARSREFVIGWQLAEQDKNPYPPNRPQGGTLENDPFGDVGKPSENDPVLPSRQPIATPRDATSRRVAPKSVGGGNVTHSSRGQKGFGDEAERLRNLAETP